MAKIEMDVSEYEAMKKVEQLLENSLEKERKLQEQIEILNEEKINALEEAKMKVVKIVKNEQQDYIYQKRDNNYIKKYLLSYLNDPYRHQVPDNDYLIDLFFEKSTAFGLTSTEVTTHGLDEVKKELRDELSDETKSKLENAKRVTQENYGLKKEHNDLDKLNQTLQSQVDNLLQVGEKLSEKLEVFETKVNNIQDIIKYDIPWWKLYDALNKIGKIIINDKATQ